LERQNFSESNFMSDWDLFKEASDALTHLEPAIGVQWVGRRFGKEAKFSTSLGLEDQVITYLIASFPSDIEIFTLDTGRLFQETYDVLDLSRKKYGHPIHVYFPDGQKTEELLSKKGPNSFYDSVDNRKECCHIRKVEPLRRALKGATVWITGIRADQTDNRNAMNTVEWDDNYQVIKYNPLLKWTLSDVEGIIKEHHIPVNTLHKKGFPSIGCAPCTRAVMEGEDPRAGRWWWESSNKECGLHVTKIS
jgi:phosphoadenosine phosphosulfate reductase